MPDNWNLLANLLGTPKPPPVAEETKPPAPPEHRSPASDNQSRDLRSAKSESSDAPISPRSGAATSGSSNTAFSASNLSDVDPPQAANHGRGEQVDVLAALTAVAPPAILPGFGIAHKDEAAGQPTGFGSREKEIVSRERQLRTGLDDSPGRQRDDRQRRGPDLSDPPRRKSSEMDDVDLSFQSPPEEATLPEPARGGRRGQRQRLTEPAAEGSASAPSRDAQSRRDSGPRGEAGQRRDAQPRGERDARSRGDRDAQPRGETRPRRDSNSRDEAFSPRETIAHRDTDASIESDSGERSPRGGRSRGGRSRGRGRDSHAAGGGTPAAANPRASFHDDHDDLEDEIGFGPSLFVDDEPVDDILVDELSESQAVKPILDGEGPPAGRRRSRRGGRGRGRGRSSEKPEGNVGRDVSTEPGVAKDDELPSSLFDDDLVDDFEAERFRTTRSSPPRARSREFGGGEERIHSEMDSPSRADSPARGRSRPEPLDPQPAEDRSRSAPVPTWNETVNLMVDINMKGRKNPPRGGSNDGNRGRRR